MFSGGTMSGTEIVRFVKRNAYRPDLIAPHWHQRGGRTEDFVISVSNPMKGFCYKVQLGMVPERNIEDPETGGYLVRGWKTLFQTMLVDGILKDTKEVRQALGDTEVQTFLTQHPEVRFNAQAHGLA